MKTARDGRQHHCIEGVGRVDARRAGDRAKMVPRRRRAGPRLCSVRAEARLWLERALAQGMPEAEVDLAELTAPLRTT
jgi:hypothetical protein